MQQAGLGLVLSSRLSKGQDKEQGNEDDIETDFHNVLPATPHLCKLLLSVPQSFASLQVAATAPL